MYELNKTDHELSHEADKLSDSFRKSHDETEKDKLRKELRVIVEKHFNVRQERRRLELRRLEKELENLRQSIDGREQRRTEIIDRRISELTGDESVYGF